VGFPDTTNEGGIMFGFQLACGLLGSICIGAAIGGPVGFFAGSLLAALSTAGTILMDAVATAEDLEGEDL
jgi:hypothetical protein